MKRDQIITLLDETGDLFDTFDGAILKDRQTGEEATTVTSDEIRAFQTAFAFCRHMLEGDYEPRNAMALAGDMLTLYGGLKAEGKLQPEGSDD